MNSYSEMQSEKYFRHTLTLARVKGRLKAVTESKYYSKEVIKFAKDLLNEITNDFEAVEQTYNELSTTVEE